MNSYPIAKIDACSIANRTYFATSTVEHYKARVKTFAEDDDARLGKHECIVCHTSQKAGGALCCSRQCGLCDEIIHSGSTCIGVLCVRCARKNGLCAHCGGDIDLKQRRKPRPFQKEANV